jgi:asparagine synthase (glutamine-hydrolysing)
MIPFVDYRVLDFALSIPRAQFHNGYTGRYIYRAAFDDMIPQSLRDMHYKDTPSQESYMPQMDMRKHFQESKTQLLKYLDREFWAPYLDFEALERVELPLAYTRADYLRASSLLNEATQCAVIHHVIKNAAVWSENSGNQTSV